MVAETVTIVMRAYTASWMDRQIQAVRWAVSARRLSGPWKCAAASLFLWRTRACRPTQPDESLGHRSMAERRFR